MTIKTAGTVTIMEDKVLVEHFHFQGVDFGVASIDALEWAQGRLVDAIVEQKEALAQRVADPTVAPAMIYVGRATITEDGSRDDRA